MTNLCRRAWTMGVLGCLCVLMWSCSTSTSTSNTSSSSSSSKQSQQNLQAAVSMGYIVVHRNTPLFVQPDEDAQYIQHLSQSEQRALRKKARQLADRRKREAEKKARIKRERAKALALKKKKRRKKRPRKRRRKKKLTRAQRQAIAEAKQARQAKARRKRAVARLRRLDRASKRRTYAHPSQEMIVLKVVGKKGGWLKVQTLTPSEESQHCWRGALSDLQPATLTFYVREDAPQTVLTRMERFEVYRGTEVKLQPGTVLTEEGEGVYSAHADGVRVRLSVPSDVVGSSYKNPRRFESPESDTIFKPEAFAERLLKIDKKQRLEYSTFYDQFIVRTGKSSRYNYATVQLPCAEVTVMHPEDMTERVGRRRTKRIGSDRKTFEAPYAKANVMLYTRTGKRFGQTHGKLALGQSSGKSNGRSCFSKNLWSRYDRKAWRTVVFCLNANDVVSTWP